MLPQMFAVINKKVVLWFESASNQPGWLAKPQAGKSCLSPLNTCATHLLLRYHCTSWWYIFQAVTKEICIKRIKLYIFCNPSPVSGSVLVTCTLYSVQAVLKEPDHRQDEFSWWPEPEHCNKPHLHICSICILLSWQKPMVRTVMPRIKSLI